MKKIFYISVPLLLLFNSHYLVAQNKIIKRNGDIIECKIKEIGTDVIKYTISDLKDVIFDIKKTQVEKLVFANGKELIIDHAAAASETTEMNSEDLFLVQRKLALKTALLSPLWGVTSFTFEKAISPGRSWEVTMGIVGLGFGNPDNASGVAFRGSYKFIKSPDHYMKGMRYAHILKGSYLRPEIAIAKYSGTSIGWYNSTDYKRFKFALLINLGKQVVYSDFLLIDYYCGIGYGYTNDEFDDSFAYPYAFAVGRKSRPLALSWGFRIGIILGKKYTPNN